MPKKQWSVTLRGEEWTIRLARLRGDSHGHCYPQKKEIVIDEKLYRNDHDKYVEILLHEIEHAQYWFLDEEVVDDAAKEKAAALHICEAI